MYYRRDFILFNLFNFLLVIKIHIFCNSSCSSKTTEMTRVFKKKFKTGIYASFCGTVFFHTPVEFEKIPDSYSYDLDKACSSATKMFESDFDLSVFSPDFAPLVNKNRLFNCVFDIQILDNVKLPD